MKYTFIGLLSCFCLLIMSCSQSNVKRLEGNQRNLARNHLSLVEKAWNARREYDEQRRLLIPKIAGSRWGSTQEYKEDGTLVYKDWWVRDVKVEDLEPNPTTTFTPLEEDSSMKDYRSFLELNEVDGENKIDAEFPEVSKGEDVENFPMESVGETVFPQEAIPFEEVGVGMDDPFAPLPKPNSDLEKENSNPEDSPFGPLELPF